MGKEPTEDRVPPCLGEACDHREPSKPWLLDYLKLVSSPRTALTFKHTIRIYPFPLRNLPLPTVPITPTLRRLRRNNRQSPNHRTSLRRQHPANATRASHNPVFTPSVQVIKPSVSVATPGKRAKILRRRPPTKLLNERRDRLQNPTLTLPLRHRLPHRPYSTANHRHQPLSHSLGVAIVVLGLARGHGNAAKRVLGQANRARQASYLPFRAGER
jgi:hypothetical protein